MFRSNVKGKRSANLTTPKILSAPIIGETRPRGLDACQQHCKISATDVSENVYLCSERNYHEKEICIGLYTRYYVFIFYPSYPYYMLDSHHLLILHTF